ncbi:MAG: signal peptidase I [Armatimonadota bacterium]
MKRKRRFLKEFAETLTMTLLVFIFLVTFIVQGYKVYGSCMEPNIRTGERLLGNKFVYRFDQPKRGDVVIFKYPPNPRKTFIKRVIALPGETVEIHGGKVYINGEQLSEMYVRNVPHGDFPPERVMPGSVFVLGDNRDESNDSRYWGELPLDNVQAKAWMRYWPLSRAQVFN